jgi:hypothetical protein
MHKFHYTTCSLNQHSLVQSFNAVNTNVGDSKDYPIGEYAG